MTDAYVIGDIHGHDDALLGLLRSAGLIDETTTWSGGGAHLWLVGDFFDNGPRGLEAVEVVTRLQAEATAAGGQVAALLGNHDALLLSAARFGGAFRARWEENGGAERDLTRLTERHIAQLSQLPAMARAGDALLVHADACFYTRYGDSIEAVNAAIVALLASDDATAWERLLDDFGEHGAFFDSPEEGIARIRRFLDMYGGRRLIHGHTPIGKATGMPDAAVTSALVYADGRCVNVDGGIYRGGPGFVFTLEDARGET